MCNIDLFFSLYLEESYIDMIFIEKCKSVFRGRHTHTKHLMFCGTAYYADVT